MGNDDKLNLARWGPPQVQCLHLPWRGDPCSTQFSGRGCMSGWRRGAVGGNRSHRVRATWGPELVPQSTPLSPGMEMGRVTIHGTGSLRMGGQVGAWSALGAS